jgi:hypothetical protein
MAAFTELELAALHSIFSETPDLTDGLERQLASAHVTERENSGGGFFTTVSVADDVPPVNSSKVLGYETHAQVEGLEYGFGFVLFMDNGRLHLLEGYANGPENTAPLDLETLKFEIYKQTPVRLS